jgi:hypothetical protein
MSRGIDRRFVLAGLLSVASCTTQSLPLFHFTTTFGSRLACFEAIRAFARDEGFKLEERHGRLGSFGFFGFILSDWRTTIMIGSDLNAPVASFGEISNLFKVDIASIRAPWPWAVHEAGMRALAGRLQAALTAVPGVVVVNLSEPTGQPSP